jgi:Na+-translocating ferredoxin:NAD+ oxidoreductase RNF subunit RnfB
VLFLSPQLPKDRIRDCRGCKACAEYCPAKAICFNDPLHFEVARTACWSYIMTTEDGECWECSQRCYNGVIKMQLFEAITDDHGNITEIRQKNP